MSAQRVDMRNIKECLRLKFEGGLSHEKIAQALQLSNGVGSKYVTTANETGLKWSTLAMLDEVELAAALLPAAKVRHTVSSLLFARLGIGVQPRAEISIGAISRNRELRSRLTIAPKELSVAPGSMASSRLKSNVSH